MDKLKDKVSELRSVTPVFTSLKKALSNQTDYSIAIDDVKLHPLFALFFSDNINKAIGELAFLWQVPSPLTPAGQLEYLLKGTTNNEMVTPTIHTFLRYFYETDACIFPTLVRVLRNYTAYEPIPGVANLSSNYGLIAKSMKDNRVGNIKAKCRPTINLAFALLNSIGDDDIDPMKVPHGWVNPYLGWLSERYNNTQGFRLISSLNQTSLPTIAYRAQNGKEKIISSSELILHYLTRGIEAEGHPYRKYRTLGGVNTYFEDSYPWMIDTIAGLVQEAYRLPEKPYIGERRLEYYDFLFSASSDERRRYQAQNNLSAKLSSLEGFDKENEIEYQLFTLMVFLFRNYHHYLVVNPRELSCLVAFGGFIGYHSEYTALDINLYNIAQSQTSYEQGFFDDDLNSEIKAKYDSLPYEVTIPQQAWVGELAPREVGKDNIVRVREDSPLSSPGSYSSSSDDASPSSGSDDSDEEDMRYYENIVY